MKNETKKITFLSELILSITEMEIPLDTIFEEVCGIKWNPESRNFYEMGLDEIDVISVVIEIEKEYNLNIIDYAVVEMLNIRPQSLITEFLRNKKLKEIGI